MGDTVGGPFIKLFGFSFTAVRLSTLPLAMASVYLLHASLVRFGITARNAMVGALTLGLFPLFLPLAASYMTDIAGLFCILLCLYLCQRALAAHSNRATIPWLTCAALTNLAGGTVRQIVWLGALVMVPSTAWVLRKRSGVIRAASLLWIGSALSVLACIRWFERQPYASRRRSFRAR
jgi:4-amino-4-deoxy-L-arabinose transferase-like glycosyltransferase